MMFDNIDFVKLTGQAIGFIAIAISFLSFQSKSRRGILIIQAIGNSVWAIHFAMIGSPAGAIVNAFCTVRNLLYAQKDSWRWLRHIAVPIVVSVLAVGISVTGTLLFSTDGIWDILLDFLLLPSTILSSVAFYLNDEKKIRIFSIFIASSWLAYNIADGSVAGTIAEIFNLTSVIIAIIRFSIIGVRRKKKEREKAASQLEDAVSPAE